MTHKAQNVAYLPANHAEILLNLCRDKPKAFLIFMWLGMVSDNKRLSIFSDDIVGELVLSRSTVIKGIKRSRVG
jgi:hypothetical protein